MDILPTALDLAGVCDERIRGPSLRQVRPRPSRRQLFFRAYPSLDAPTSHGYGVQAETRKLIFEVHSTSLVAYDLAADPAERAPRLVESDELLGDLDAWMSLHAAALAGREACLER